MRPSSQCHKQQRNSGSRAKSKPMLVNREQKPSEKPPAKNCTKCKESANYLKIFVKRLGTIEELAVSKSLSCMFLHYYLTFCVTLVGLNRIQNGQQE